MIEATRARPVYPPGWPEESVSPVSTTMEPSPPNSQGGQGRSNRDAVAGTRLIALLASALAALALSVGAVFLLIQFRESLEGLGQWGYLAVLLGELGNSAALFVPTPGPAYTFAMGSVLNPFVLGVVGGVASACGELVGYYLGAKGGRGLEHTPLYGRLQSLTERWGGGVFLSFALLPIPFDIAGIWAGTLRYPVPRFLLFTGAGKIVKVTAVALAGNYGVNWLLGSGG